MYIFANIELLINEHVVLEKIHITDNQEGISKLEKSVKLIEYHLEKYGEFYPPTQRGFINEQL